MKHRGGVRERVIEKITCVKSLHEQTFCILASDVKSLSLPFCQTPPQETTTKLTLTEALELL